MLSKKLASFIASSKQNYSYWLEQLKLDFAQQLEIRRLSVNMSYADFARTLDTSPSYVTKVFRGDTNLTMESMVKLARVTNGKIDIRIINEDAVVNPLPWLNLAPQHGQRASIVSAAAVTALEACNDDVMNIPAYG